MATRADVERLARANRNIRTLIRRDLNRVLDFIDPSDPVGARDLLEEALPPLVRQYGDVAATVAADFYDELREQVGAPGRFTATLAAAADDAPVRANVRWGVGPLFSAVPDLPAAAGRLGQVADRMALQPGRDTIALNVLRDPADVRWARVPTGAKTCAFCLMLASRGAVYRSESSAGRVGTSRSRASRGFIPPGYGSGSSSQPRPVGSKYHADCDCVPTPMWAGDLYPDGYDPDALYERYRAAADRAGTGNTKAILSELRQLEGIR